MTHHTALTRYIARYTALDHEPMRITAEIMPGNSIVWYDPPHLDGLLAWSVVREATRGEGLPQSSDPYYIPIPLQKLYTAEELPLWASTCLLPDEHVTDMAYLHKRSQSGRFTYAKSGRFQIDTQRGRWMERRVPTPTLVTMTLTADCIGNVAEVRRLLGSVTHIGKRRSAGFGEVRAWHVEERSDLSVCDLLIADGCLRRPLPLNARGLLPDGMLLDDALSLVGWTPPQWLPSTFAEGWRCGTEIIETEVTA